jgi:predicted Zn-dependent peptidase
LDETQALSIAERDFGSLSSARRIVTTAPEHDQKEPRLRIVENVSSQTELRLCFRAISEIDPLRPALDVLMRIVDDGMSTRLYHRLCDARGLCYGVSAGYDGYEDDGVIDVAAGVQHRRVALVAREILAMFDELAREGPTHGELERARRRTAWDVRAMADSAEETSAFYAAGVLFNRFSTPEEHVAELTRVSASEVREVARQLARPERLNVVAVGLLENGEDHRLEDTVMGYTGVG